MPCHANRSDREMIMRSRSGMTVIAAFAIGAIASTVAHEAFAGPITYHEGITATGSLNGVAFNSVSASFNMMNLTNTVIGVAPDFFNFGTLQVSIASGPAVTFTDVIYAFDNESTGTVGFRDLTLGDLIIAKTAAPFMSYDLKSAIGPITGPTTFGDIGQPFPTTGGLFTLSSFHMGSTFTATVAEPSSLALLGGGLLALVFILRRRKSKLARS
jgi:hypothetical protein